MTSQARFVQPPRFPTWLVNLFTGPQDDSIVGDLFEEFRNLASGSGVGFARRWYWRQAVKTAASLFAMGWLAAPWSTAAAVLGGFLLAGYVNGLPDKALSVATDRYLMYWSSHFQAYLWLLRGMLIGHIIASLFVGSIVALAAKGREMAATMTLALIFCAMAGIGCLWLAAKTGEIASLSRLLWYLADPLAIVVGGIIVRTRRSPMTAVPSA
jgi:hypothetical protein